jgi:hypothetical protein
MGLLGKRGLEGMRISWRELIAGAVVLLILGYAGHLFYNYLAIQAEIRERSARIIVPSVDDDSVAEIGHIDSMFQRSDIREGKWYLSWEIVVPESRVHYSADYYSGYRGFKVGDNVKLIHKRLCRPKQGDRARVMVPNY